MSAPGEAPRKAGRPPCCPPDLAERIHRLRDSGLSLRQIQDVLNAEGVSTPTGRSYWWKSSVDRILKTKYMRELEQEVARVDLYFTFELVGKRLDYEYGSLDGVVTRKRRYGLTWRPLLALALERATNRSERIRAIRGLEVHGI